MLRGMKSLIDRTSGTVLDDAMGIVALFAILFAGLSLPGL
jgi:hypothetical protein